MAPLLSRKTFPSCWFWFGLVFMAIWFRKGDDARFPRVSRVSSATRQWSSFVCLSAVRWCRSAAGLRSAAAAAAAPLPPPPRRRRRRRPAPPPPPTHRLRAGVARNPRRRQVIKFYQVIPNFTEFYLILPSFTEFYRVLPSFTEFYQVFPTFTKFFRVSPIFCTLNKFYLVWPSFT